MNKIDNNTILDKYKEISKLNIEEIYTKYNTSNSGLSNSEVNKRIKEYGKNIVIKEKNRSIEPVGEKPEKNHGSHLWRRRNKGGL